jgi:predicted Fe-Mo cluster-binding NifX family protein
MKIAITTGGNTTAAEVDSRFGRSPKFLIYDTETGESFVVDNTQNLNAAQGAGIQSAQNVAKTGAQAVITGHCGPKAFALLHKANIAVYHSPACSIDEALDRFKKGELKQAESADVEGHWV